MARPAAQDQKFLEGGMKNPFSNYPYSDHLPFQSSFRSPDAGIKAINVITYNMMEKCHAERDFRGKDIPANNPQNLEESDEAYENRLKSQLDLIESWADQKRDLILLQECGGLEKLITKNPKFEGYGIIYAPRTSYVDGIGALMTIYRKDRFENPKSSVPFFDPSSPVQFPSGDRIMLTELFDKESQKTISIGNLHMRYGDAPKAIQEIKDQNKRIIGAGASLVIIGGDWNHPSSLIEGSFAQKWATCYDSQKESQESLKDAPINLHTTHGNTDIPKSYDFFLAEAEKTFEVNTSGNQAFHSGFRRGSIEIFNEDRAPKKGTSCRGFQKFAKELKQRY